MWTWTYLFKRIKGTPGVLTKLFSCSLESCDSCTDLVALRLLPIYIESRPSQAHTNKHIVWIGTGLMLMFVKQCTAHKYKYEML